MKQEAVLPGYPVIGRRSDFDSRSGGALERLIFNHRLIVIAAFLLALVFLAGPAVRIGVNASFRAMIPTSHPYIVNYLAHRNDVRERANQVRIAVEARHGTIFSAAYLDTLRRISDDVFLVPGVDRPFMRSLWTPSVRWVAVTADGLSGGPVMPEDYDGSPQSIARLRANAERAGEVGRLVGADYRSSLITVPLLEGGDAAGRLDYRRFAKAMEALRLRYRDAGVRLHISGFAQRMGLMIGGLGLLLRFFAASAALATTALYVHTRCLRSTLAILGCTLAAVVCLLGILQLLGRSLDPYSVLVPFLVFAIGISHGSQKMNGVAQDIGRGTHKAVAARYCFRRLFFPGLVALLCDAAGFAILLAIPIDAVRALALSASIGVALLIVTNLVVLPVLLSYSGIDMDAARRSVARESRSLRQPLFRALSRLSTRRGAAAALGIALLAAGAGLVFGRRLQIGDTGSGAPELRADSRYNRDAAFVAAHYATGNDVLTAIVTTPRYRCADYPVLARVDVLEWRLRQLPGVASTQSLADQGRAFMVGMNEGNPKWFELPHAVGMLHAIAAHAPPDLRNADCSSLPLYVYLRDHRAATLERVTGAIAAFAKGNDSARVKFLLAGGNAGIAAATNSVVAAYDLPLLAGVYAAVALLVLLAFRSWRAVACVLMPLALTSVLCRALMALLGLGVKVATLPVMALGVGIGVDYGIYMLAMLRAQMGTGKPLPQAFAATLAFSGRVVLLTGFTLAVAVGSWIFSPIRFEADMGLLLACMFVCNLAGALMLLPALATLLYPGSENRGAPLRTKTRGQK